MRWILLLLFLLNIGFWAWQYRAVPEVARELTLVGPQAESITVKPLRLLGEDEARVLAKTGIAPGEGNLCLVLGGFEMLKQARQLEQRLLSLDVEGRVVTVETSVGTDHWVYIVPLASRQAALRQLRELQVRGIDSYLITEGELANGILLGVFPHSTPAIAVTDKLRAAGYEPVLRELPRISQEYWVQVSTKSQRLVDSEMLSRVAGDFSDLKHQLISCSGVAQAQGDR